MEKHGSRRTNCREISYFGFYRNFLTHSDFCSNRIKIRLLHEDLGKLVIVVYSADNCVFFEVRGTPRAVDEPKHLGLQDRIIRNNASRSHRIKTKERVDHADTTYPTRKQGTL